MKWGRSKKNLGGNIKVQCISGPKPRLGAISDIEK